MTFHTLLFPSLIDPCSRTGQNPLAQDLRSTTAKFLGGGLKSSSFRTHLLSTQLLFENFATIVQFRESVDFILVFLGDFGIGRFGFFFLREL